MIGDARQIAVLILTAVFFSGSCSALHNDSIATDQVAAPALDFNYISVNDDRIRTHHALEYEVSISGDFKITPPKNRIDYFNSTPYRISLAAFITDDSALMIHAEEVADSSGASDYSHLAVTEWPDETFRSSGPDCLQIPAEEVEEEHDLSWLRQNGFESSGSILYAQYFATTADMNTELVISILQRVASCDEAFANSELIRALQARTSVNKVKLSSGTSAGPAHH